MSLTTQQRQRRSCATPKIAYSRWRTQTWNKVLEIMTHHPPPPPPPAMRSDNCCGEMLLEIQIKYWCVCFLEEEAAGLLLLRPEESVWRTREIVEGMKRVWCTFCPPSLLPRYCKLTPSLPESRLLVAWTPHLQSGKACLRHTSGEPARPSRWWLGEGGICCLLFNDLTSVRLSLQRLSRSCHKGTVYEPKARLSRRKSCRYPFVFRHKTCKKKKGRAARPLTFERRLCETFFNSTGGADWNSLDATAVPGFGQWDTIAFLPHIIYRSPFAFAAPRCHSLVYFSFPESQSIASYARWAWRIPFHVPRTADDNKTKERRRGKKKLQPRGDRENRQQ